jgi:hypothetical protein
LKKGLIIIAIIALILLFPAIKSTLDKLMTPDKVLLVGNQINDTTIDFSKEIRDKEKINEFENIFKEVEFSEGEWNKETTYPDMITHIRHKEGIATHWFEIWIDEEEGMAVMSMSEETLVGRLTKSQVDILRRIVNE